jgi:DNA adenine methylase
MAVSSEPGRHASPLRYPGGKGKIAKFIKLMIIENDLVGTEYVEPYAGGASVALELLFEEYASHVHINDLNRGIHAFWDAVLNDNAALVDRIRRTPVTMATWRAQRATHENAESDGLDLAFATFFLNRTNRSGIISGGPIGGVDQGGPWKLDARYNTTELIKRIEKVGRYRHRISLTGLDAVALLENAGSWLEPDSLTYLDPPYYVKGRGLYDNFYGPEDHAAVAEVVRTLPGHWIVSYDNVAAIRALYSHQPNIQYALSYSAHTAGQGSEVMFFSPDLHIAGAAPAGLRARDVSGAQRAAR